MRIASVEAIPAGTACYVRVTAEDGTSGVGESTYFGWPTAVADIASGTLRAAQAELDASLGLEP